MITFQFLFANLLVFRGNFILAQTLENVQNVLLCRSALPPVGLLRKILRDCLAFCLMIWPGQCSFARFSVVLSGLWSRLYNQWTQLINKIHGAQNLQKKKEIISLTRPSGPSWSKFIYCRMMFDSSNDMFVTWVLQGYFRVLI